MWLLKKLLSATILTESWNDWSLWRKKWNKYLVLDDVDENKEVSKKNLKKFGKVFKNKLKRLMVAKKLNMGKIFKKISFESNDDFPLNKPIKLCLLTIIIRSVLVKMVNFTLNYLKMRLCMSYKNATASKNWCFRRNWCK